MRNVRRHPRLAVIVLVASLLCLSADPTAAEDAVGDEEVVHSWTLVPASDQPERASSFRPNLSFEVEPGSSIEDAVTVLNYGSVPLTFEVFATDAFNNADGDFDLLPTDEEPQGVGAWVTVAQRHVTVPANGSASIPITLAVPADARPGDHVGALLASAPVTGQGPGDQVLTFDRRTGTRLYVRVDGPLAPELAVAAVRTTYRSALDPLGGTADVTYRIENQGNVRLGASHVASVGGPFGLFSKHSPHGTLDELLPGESVTIRTTVRGVAASAVAITDVNVDAVAIAEVDDLPAASARSVTPAVPWSLLAFASAAALAAYARRSYRRRTAVEPLGVRRAGRVGAP